MHTINELQEKQALPLDLKIRLTRDRVRAWINEYGKDGVYISFSGGKDSTVLLDLVRNEFGYKDIRACFVDVPTQYPELRSFVKTFDKVDIVTPKISFFQVCEKYGFPLFGKEISECIQAARKYLVEVFAKEVGTTGIRDTWSYVCEHEDILERSLKENFRKEGQVVRTARMMGWFTKKNTIDMSVKAKDKSGLNFQQYKFMLGSPFGCSSLCCDYMKKKPINRYATVTGRVSMTAQMAEESRMRTRVWLKQGCNAFNAKHPISNPMSFWTEQDVLRYIKDKGIKICSVYGEVVTDDEEMGQMQLSDYAGMELFDIGQQCLHCTGCQRTGCVLCGFGAHIQDDDRFIQLKETHPKMYALLDVVQNNGYTMRQAIDWISEHSNKIIRY